MSEKTAFETWFDIKDKDHLKALDHLIEHREWPKHFLPADVDFSEGSLAIVNKRIIQAWIKMHVKPLTPRSSPGYAGDPGPEAVIGSPIHTSKPPDMSLRGY